MRPTYETEQDRAREAKVGQYLSEPCCLIPMSGFALQA